MGPHELAWKEFFLKVSARGLELVPLSVKDNAGIIEEWDHPEKEKIRLIWEELVANSFREGKTSEWSSLRKRIKRL